MQYAHQADIVRVMAIYQYGGIWLDSDTLLLQNPSSLFEHIDIDTDDGEDDVEATTAARNGFFILENNEVVWNGVFGSRAGTPLLQHWKDTMLAIVNKKGKNIEWTEIGNALLTNTLSKKKTLFEGYHIYKGLDTVYPVDWHQCVEHFLNRPYEHYQTLVRSFQPFVVLVNSVYKQLAHYSETQILAGVRPLNYFLTLSLKNIWRKEYEVHVYSEVFQRRLQEFNQSLVTSTLHRSLVPALAGSIFYENGQSNFHVQPFCASHEVHRMRLFHMATRCRHMMEIGFGGGHTAFLCLSGNANLKITAVDAAKHLPAIANCDPEIYVHAASARLQMWFGERMKLLVGTCSEVLPIFQEKNKDCVADVDLLHVDVSVGVETLRDVFIHTAPLLAKGAYIVLDNARGDAEVEKMCDALLMSGYMVPCDDFPPMSASSTSSQCRGVYVFTGESNGAHDLDTVPCISSDASADSRVDTAGPVGVHGSLFDEKTEDLDFVEIGTADFDTLIQKCDDKTRGISVEPLRYYLDKLPAKKGVIKVNAAITQRRESDSIRIYYLPEHVIVEKKYPMWFKGCNTVGTYHPLHKSHGVTGDVVVEESPLLNVDEFYRKYGIGHVRFLKIDTEGHDTVILHGLFEFLRQQPKYRYPHKIQFESNEWTPKDKVDEIVAVAKNCGYKVASRGYDTMLVRPPVHFVEFINIEKTGGMSIREALRKYVNDYECEGKKHLTASELKQRIGAETFGNAFKVAFVRNPWARLVSLYKFCRTILPATDIFNQEMCRQTGKRLAEVTFRDFILGWNGVVVYPSGHVLDMKQPQVAAISDSETQEIIVDFIGKFENLAADYAKLCTNVIGLEKAQIPSLPHIFNTSHGAAGDAADYRKFYEDDAEVARTVAGWVQHDVQVFGYEF